MSERIDVAKTYKLVINGAFVRSESGLTTEICDASGQFFANVARASRKDARDAVVSARAALAGWSTTTAYNRGQVLYRLAEMAESRREELRAHVAALEGCDDESARERVSVAIDRLVWYAGWTDKLAHVVGSANPVAGPYFNFSVPNPTGVIALVAPEESSLVELIDQVGAALVSGNTVVVVASETRPTPAVLLGELAATADVPAGVLNVLTGARADTVPVLCAHADVDGTDLSGLDDDEYAQWAPLCAQTIKRVARTGFEGTRDSMRRVRAFIEITTVWHTVGQ